MGPITLAIAENEATRVGSPFQVQEKLLPAMSEHSVFELDFP